ncbi:t26-9p [Thermococcus sp.]|uniref:t26-9p n=1 Tax=Thermococcus sp. TaxID=35749 RepID=UPI0026370FA9|nr:t26-9p [Thermococcus sp.]
MDVNGLIGQLQGLAGSHPYLALGIILILIGLLAKGKTALIFYALGTLALLKSFGLTDTFFSFIKSVPGMLKDALGGLGGV